MAENRDDPDFFIPFDAREAPPSGQRQYADRRGLRHGVRYSGSDAGREIEHWLESNCTGKWSLELESMNATLTKKTLLVAFELETDKRAFMEMLAASGARAKG